MSTRIKDFCLKCFMLGRIHAMHQGRCPECGSGQSVVMGANCECRDCRDRPAVCLEDEDVRWLQ